MSGPTELQTPTPDPVNDDADLPEIRRQAEFARARLVISLVDVQARLRPKALAAEATQKLKDAAQGVARDGLVGVKRHPLALAGVTAAAGLFFARGPLRRLIANHIDETPEPPASLTVKRARARRKGTAE